MNERTPVSAYRLLSSPCNKSIVFVSSRRSPCTYGMTMLIGDLKENSIQTVAETIVLSRVIMKAFNIFASHVIQTFVNKWGLFGLF